MADHLELASLVNGEPVAGTGVLEVRDPYSGDVVGTVREASAGDLERAVSQALRGGTVLTRHDRAEILERARDLLESRAGEFAELIRRESGLCQRETSYEVGRAADVLRFSAREALRDDGEIFSCDVTAAGKKRKIFTLREPVPLVGAITPFNHPLNQVAHKLGPAIAADAPVILKPSERTPLTALRFTELLLEAGLPPERLSTLVGPVPTLVEPLVRHESISLISFTGSVGVGKLIARRAGYKKLCLELGGNSPLIVLEDAPLELAVELAAEGCFRNSGQRCTAVKRVLVHEKVLEAFTEKFVERAREYTCGDPANPATRVGTVIDEAAAIELERRIEEARKMGARVLLGGGRSGALLEPTVLDRVPRDAPMVVEESFGPLAPILGVRDLDDAIELANSTAYGLSAGIVTENLPAALRAVRELRTGTVNVNEVPGYRLESTPFGGIGDSGLGVKEGVIEAVRFLTTIKTFSLPW